jgi:hypothetical protein
MKVKVYFFGATKDEVRHEYELAASSTVADLKAALVAEESSPYYKQKTSDFEITDDPPGGALSDNVALIDDDQYHAVMQ